MSSKNPDKGAGLPPYAGQPPQAPERPRQHKKRGDDGNGERSQSTAKSSRSSKHNRSHVGREPRRNASQSRVLTIDDADAAWGGTFAQSEKHGASYDEGNMQMPTRKMNMDTAKESRSTEPSYPFTQPAHTQTSEPAFRPSHPKRHVQHLEDPRSVHELDQAWEVQKPQKTVQRSRETKDADGLGERENITWLEEPSKVHELKEPHRTQRREKPSRMYEPESPRNVHKAHHHRNATKPEEHGKTHDLKVHKHSRSHKDVSKTSYLKLEGKNKPEHVDAPPVLSGDTRRGSFSTDERRSVYGSSRHSSSDEEQPPKSASRSTTSTPNRSLSTYSDDGSTSDRTRRSSSQGRDRGRGTAPPLSLQNHGRSRDGRFSTDRLRVGAMPPDTRAGRGSLDSRRIRNDVMANYLYQQAMQRSLLVSAELWQGVVLKRAPGDYACCPPQMVEIQGGLHDAVLKMNVRCAMTVDTHVIQTILKSVGFAGFDFVPLPNGLRVQVVPTMRHLPACQLHHFAAFVADLEVLVVWDDDPENLLARADDLQHKFVQLLWSQGEAKDGDSDQAAAAAAASAHDFWDLETAEKEKPRRTKLNSAFVTACTLLISVVCLGTGWRNLTLEIRTDGSLVRLALLVTIPAQLFACQFFFQALIGNACQMFGPISQVSSNSKCYSGKPPARRLRRSRDILPHLTIQMPVYKEGLQNVIRPSVLSIKGAISTYEMQGGTASIFVNDDGMQLLSPEAAQARRDFYDEHQIGWVARPGHGSVAGSRSGRRPFKRRGKFKKASNMNFCLNVSNRVEEKLSTVDRSGLWTQTHEDMVYRQALDAVLAEDEGRTWADGNIRVGEYIMIVDSDTRIPQDCILDAMTEMDNSPQVAIMQFSAGVLNVTDSFFENGVTWFTEMIYTAITYAVAGGDATPFVGHNAILRWAAIQTAAGYHDSRDGYEKYWSEDHVSEDFAMSLCMLTAGYQLRYAAYQGAGFKEGVSLTVYDELARWEKYAYGVNEVIFHPWRKWLTRGPFTPLFRRFIGASAIPITHKLTILAYLGTYYAIASAFPLSAMNYFLTGWEYGIYDKFYRDSFSIFFSIILVFTCMGNVALATLRYRLKQGGLLDNLKKNIQWTPFFTIFLGGLSLHLAQSILCHSFEIEMSWGATAKEAENIVFGKEIVRILKKFKGTFFICFLSIGVMVYLAAFAPYNWRIVDLPCVFPIAILVASHLLLPLALSPALMRLSW